jgi:antibiotic biosynthesis monooxygenase (ABM) superfamily enzyme
MGNTMNAPRPWKIVLVNFAVVFPTLQSITHFIAPRLSDLPVLAREALVVFLMCIVLSYAIPKANRYLASWLVR